MPVTSGYQELEGSALTIAGASFPTCGQRRFGDDKIGVVQPEERLLKALRTALDDNSLER